jgi:FkbM family methyltransferase
MKTIAKLCIERAASKFLSALPSRRTAFVGFAKRLAGQQKFTWITRFIYESLVNGYVADACAQSEFVPVRITPTNQLLLVDLHKHDYRYWPFADFPIYDPSLTEYLYCTLQPGDVFFDLGANIGYFSIIAATIVGERGKVFAFDANKAMVEQISRSSVLNKFESIIEAVHIAFNDGNLPVERLFLNPEDTGISSIAPAILAGHFETGALTKDRYVDVPASSFDNWILRHPIKKIDCLKVDIEGAEDMLIRGMKLSLSRFQIRHVICETSGASEFFRTMTDFGYRARPLSLQNPELRWGNWIFELE